MCDLKDRRDAYGPRLTKIRDRERRDRFLLVFALAYLVQRLVGHASWLPSLDSELCANTPQERTHSLLRQGGSLLGELVPETYRAIDRALPDYLRSSRIAVFVVLAQLLLRLW